MIVNILLVQILLSQTIFKVEIKKNHEYQVYNNENLQLILDKTNSSYFFTYLPPQTGDPVLFSEGDFKVFGKILILISRKQNDYNPKLFRDLSELKFKMKRKKIIPNVSSEYNSYFNETLCKSTFKEYPNLVYIK